jgi:hypothetical protein
MKVFLALLIVGIVTGGFQSAAQADVKVDPNLQQNFTLLDDGQPTSSDTANALLMTEQQSGQKDDVKPALSAPEKSQCTVSNKQFASCLR